MAAPHPVHRPDLSSLSLDPFWTSIEGLDSHAAFERLADSITFRPEVPPDVAGRFDLVRAAVRHAATEAVLADAAFARSLLTLELALSRRHEDLGSPLPKKKRSFAGLIEWGGRVPLFENGPEAIHAARKLRNRLVAHPHGDARAFYHVLQVVREIPLLINGLYDDPDLRRERLDTWTALGSALDVATREGAVLDASAMGLGRRIVYAAMCPVVENRDGPLRIQVLAWPIFEPPAPERPVAIPPPIVVEGSSWDGAGEGVSLALADPLDGNVTFTPISNVENVTRFSTWRVGMERSQASLSALRSLAHHASASARSARLHGHPVASGGALIERVASAPIGVNP